MKRLIFIPVIGTTSLIIAASLLGGCSRPAKKEPPGAPVVVAHAMETNIPVQIDPPPVGHVTPYSSVTIRPQIGGAIQKIHFKEGQDVKKGDLLFTIDPRPSEAELDAARAALARDTAQMKKRENPI
ncbi:MAG: biotin/lipoyl-binding protein [Limisphaerales bacterium]